MRPPRQSTQDEKSILRRKDSSQSIPLPRNVSTAVFKLMLCLLGPAEPEQAEQQKEAMEQWMSLVWSVMGLVAFLRSVLPAEILMAMDEYKQRILEMFKFKCKEEQCVEVHQYSSGHNWNQLYTYLDLYLGSLQLNPADTLLRAACLRIDSDNPQIHLSLAPGQSIRDTFRGTVMRWQFNVEQVSKGGGDNTQDQNHYTLTFPKAQEQLVSPYLEYVLQQGKLIEHRDRGKELHTNMDDYWHSVPFSPPATFDTLAMEPDVKKLLLDDLEAFKQGGMYYTSVGKAWKRGYLLYGPPGTGKSTLIGAMANLTGYDVYDLELTKVPSNTQLRQLLMNIRDRAIIVIEDIDCSLNLANRDQPEKVDDNGITLSGLLNFTDGFWSACGKERIFVFTTNYLDRLDPALVRSGRMDMHICMSYCSFQIFKSLAHIYLKIQEEDEAAVSYYPQIEQLLHDVHITPADVSERLTRHKTDTRQALANLVKHLQEIKNNPVPKHRKKKQKQTGDAQKQTGRL